MKTGKVTLVGAGPGGCDLLTLKGAQAIAQADAVVFDRLVSSDILNLIPQSAKRVNVGKENNHHPVPQNQINAILVELAQQGNHVVRLKGGDCFLFGRGGEECEYLLEHGVPFEVVPGVTSALAVPAYAGIPVTHRDYCSSVHIITAHARAGKKPDIDFESLVRLNATLVFLMGLTALEMVCNGLLAAGIPADTPAAVIENGTRGSQRKVVADVMALPEQVRAAGLKSPALIVVGRVCSLSEQLDWFTPLPLHGKTIVVTRPRERIGTLSDKLRALGANVIEYPCIETMEIKNTQKMQQALTDSYQWIVLTSPTGVHAMVHMLRCIGKDLRVFWGCKFAAIGAGTNQELKKYGISADLIPEVWDSTHLADSLLAVLKPTEKVLLLRAEQASAEVPEKLSAAGVSFFDVPTYRTVYRTEQENFLYGKDIDIVTFTSASTVEGFAHAAAGMDFTAFTALCIGQQTATAAKKYGMHVKIAKKASIQAMIDALMEE